MHQFLRRLTQGTPVELEKPGSAEEVFYSLVPAERNFVRFTREIKTNISLCVNAKYQWPQLL